MGMNDVERLASQKRGQLSEGNDIFPESSAVVQRQRYDANPSALEFPPHRTSYCHRHGRLKSARITAFDERQNMSSRSAAKATAYMQDLHHCHPSLSLNAVEVLL
jgi:hypothetical protein